MAAVNTFNTAADIPLMVENVELPCRLDSGSPFSFVTYSCLKTLNCINMVKRNVSPQLFVSVDGTKFEAKDYVYLHVSIPEGDCISVPFKVINGSVPIILGEDALRILGCIINYRDKIVVFSDNKTHVCSVSETKISDSQFLARLDLGEWRNEKGLKDLVISYRDVFSENSTDVGKSISFMHGIPTGDASPVYTKPYRRSAYENELCNSHVCEMIKNGVIEETCSEWNSPSLFVPKKDGKKRFVIDFRKINAVTSKDKYPMTHVDDALDQIAGSQWFSTLDMTSGYWQIPLAPSDKEKTAFTTTEGQFQFKVMPFGLCNAGATFQRSMKKVLKDLPVPVYLDDVIAGTATIQQNLKLLEQIFIRLRNEGLKLNPDKCHFGQKEVNYLGFIVGKGMVRTDPKKMLLLESTLYQGVQRSCNDFWDCVLFTQGLLRSLRSLLHLCTKFNTKHQNLLKDYGAKSIWMLSWICAINFQLIVS